MEPDYCQFVYTNLLWMSAPDSAQSVIWNLKRLVWHTAILGPLRFMSRKMGSNEPWVSLAKHAWRFGIFGPSEYQSNPRLQTQVSNALRGKEPKHRSSGGRKSKLNLVPGDWVEIKSFEDIFNTLNEEGKLRGLVFIKEMRKYCGKRFKVFKKLDKIVLETTGEMRRIRSPTFLLEGVLCDGEAHGNCDRSCFCFWREDWLKPVSEPADEASAGRD